MKKIFCDIVLILFTMTLSSTADASFNMECEYTFSKTSALSRFGTKSGKYEWSSMDKPPHKSGEKVGFMSWDENHVNIVHSDQTYKRQFFIKQGNMITVIRKGSGFGNPYFVTYTIYTGHMGSVKSRHYKSSMSPNTETKWGKCKKV